MSVPGVSFGLLLFPTEVLWICSRLPLYLQRPAWRLRGVASSLFHAVRPEFRQSKLFVPAPLPLQGSRSPRLSTPAERSSELQLQLRSQRFAQASASHSHAARQTPLPRGTPGEFGFLGS